MASKRRWWIAALSIAVLVLGLWVTWLAVRPPLMEVHGRKVEIRLRGMGSPTVVFELGASGGSLAYWRVQNAVAKHTGTVIYERPGLGRSSMVETPRSAEVIAQELHDLLNISGQKPPYVLVGHSYGGLLVRVFAHMFPTETAGLVLVDPATEGMYEYLQKSTPEDWAAAATALGAGFQKQWAALPITIAQAEAAWPLPAVPVTILTTQKPLGQWPLKRQEDMDVWEREHQRLAAKIPGVKRVWMSDSDHMSILLKDQLADEILKVISESQSIR